MTGIPVIDEASAIQAGRWFNARGVRYALITMAAAGAVLVSADEVAHFAAIPVNVVDTTAAGDAFAGYLGASIALGHELPDSICRAIAAGALTVTKRGASPSLPRHDEVDALLQIQEVACPMRRIITAITPQLSRAISETEHADLSEKETNK